MLCQRCRGVFQNRDGAIGLIDMGEMIRSVVQGGESSASVVRATDKGDTQSDIQIFIHHNLGAGLRAAAIEGCYICRTSWNVPSPAQRSALVATDGPGQHTAATLCVHLNHNALSLPRAGLTLPESMPGIEAFKAGDFLWQIQMLRGGFRNVKSAFFFQRKEESEIPNINNKLAPTTSSAQSWLIADRWLQNCAENYVECKRIQESHGWYPTRLIEIDSTEVIRLIVTNESPPAGHYVTLSHRWWPTTPRMLQSNLEEFCKNIPISQLPQTFVQAIYVAVRMKIKYIWIDSLCIVQDCRDDWLHEAPLMYKVYSHSFCNISASGSCNASEGLFYQRDLTFFTSSEIDLPSDRKNSGEKDPNYSVLDLFYWKTQLLESPLNTRGWVLQERLLSPRVLHFGRRQLLWECLQTSACEQYPEGLPPLAMMSEAASLKHLDTSLHVNRGLQQRSNSNTGSDPFQLWRRIVVAYSMTAFTKSEDKVVAFSGIARKFETIMNDKCQAGLWFRYLGCELTWMIHDGTQIDLKPSARPEQYRAPSFSWMAIDGIIEPPSISNEAMLAEILEFYLQPQDNDIMAFIKSGYLHVRGVLKCTRLEITKNSLDCRMSVEISPRSWHVTNAVARLDIAQEVTAAYCMGIQGTTSLAPGLKGLLLEQSGGQEGEYRRIGAFTMLADSDIKALQSKEYKLEYPCKDYDNDTHMSTIRIV